MARVVIAAATSSAGKTILTSGIVAALRRRGLRVQPFKAGPDYIDPSYHTCAAGVPARNLDGWLLTPPVLKELFARAAAAADVAVVEGAMGLYDGRADSAEGSTAELAKLLDAPVVLLIDVDKVSRTAAAVALGLQRFDPELRLVGVILNRVAGERHRVWAARPIETTTGLPVLGHLPRREEWALPERHLGLVPTTESRLGDDFFARLADQVEATVELDRLLALARAAPALTVEPTGLFPPAPLPPRARIALAQDEAFGFYYADNLDLLRAWGAELVPFSPLRDAALPPGVGGVYVGGGFPELFARELAANRPMRAALRRAAADGLPIYAECGGLMYLAERLIDFDGVCHEMVGLAPGCSALDRPRLTLGYRVATARRSSFLLRAGEQVRGHEFHWSQLRGEVPAATAAYELHDGAGRLEGYAVSNVVASYLHLHFGSDPRLAQRFVTACAGEAASDSAGPDSRTDKGTATR